MRTALACALALTAAPLAAQSTDTTHTRSDTAALREVRVTGRRPASYAPARTLSATKTDVPLRDTPQSATVVTRALVADQGMRSMADVARYLPGVTMGQGEGHRDQPTIRGNSSTADFFVDGVRDDVQYLRDLYNVERIEALRGSNAMLFGRGGGGGVINRVTKDADRVPHRELRLETGAWRQRRVSADAGGSLPSGIAARLNAMHETSDSFRDEVGVTRWGINPTVSFFRGTTALRAGYEHFVDERTVDRGIPSWQGSPSPAPLGAFFGDPDQNHAFAHVDAGRVLVEHAAASGVTLRNQTRYGWYDKFYQNVVPGAVNAAGTQVSLSAYNNATRRTNLFNQTDLTWGAATGSAWHTLLVGAELARQGTTNFRNTGYFGTATTTTAPFDAPRPALAVSFRQSATDADNEVTASIAALYAQDQIALSPRWQAVAGARWERFALNLDNHRDHATLRRSDAMLSPRAGLVFKPAEPASLYASWSMSHLPASGDQFASLNATTKALEPERFTNYELGAKWDPTAELSLTAAAYRLDRNNSQAKDPNDPTRTVLTGAQRTTGLELGVVGSPVARWQIAGGFAAQRARIVATTTASRAGATVPLVPARTLSLWNRLQLLDALGVGLGAVRQGRSWAAIDNTVTLPAFTRLDAALFVTLPANLRTQLNVENLGNVRYFPTSQGNNNILPGAPRSWRVAVTAAM